MQYSLLILAKIGHLLFMNDFTPFCSFILFPFITLVNKPVATCSQFHQRLCAHFLYKILAPKAIQAFRVWNFGTKNFMRKARAKYVDEIDTWYLRDQCHCGEGGSLIKAGKSVTDNFNGPSTLISVTSYLNDPFTSFRIESNAGCRILGSNCNNGISTFPKI